MFSFSILEKVSSKIKKNSFQNISSSHHGTNWTVKRKFRISFCHMHQNMQDIPQKALYLEGKFSLLWLLFPVTQASFLSPLPALSVCIQKHSLQSKFLAFSKDHTIIVSIFPTVSPRLSFQILHKRSIKMCISPRFAEEVCCERKNCNPLRRADKPMNNLKSHLICNWNRLYTEQES